MIFDFSLELPDALATELRAAAKERNISEPTFAAQVLESELASRRLENISSGQCGARLRKE
jgi:hypothetical protein